MRSLRPSPHHAAERASRALMRNAVILGAGRAGGALVRPHVEQERPPSFAHNFLLACVWLAVFSGFFVVFEPAPIDAMMIGLTVLLPVVGLTAINRANLTYLTLWMLVAACGFAAAIGAHDPTTATQHMAVSLYLFLASFVLAAFVARNPEIHGRLIMRAWVGAALVGALSGVVGYFDVFPGARDLFTLYGRATGSFKDPNVYAAFLIPPMIYLVGEALSRGPGRVTLAFMGLGLMAPALLLSFSRGAWANLAVAGLLFGTFSYAYAPLGQQRLKHIALAMVMLSFTVLLLWAAIETDAVARLFSERASFDQSYDQGPEGRFGGQAKAWGYILEHPLGIGALQFGGILHSEQPHNIFLSQFLNGGWIGGCLYIVIVLLTLGIGLKAALTPSRTSRLLIVALAAFLGLVVEGFVVETDHWRTFYLVASLVWGLSFPSAATTALQAFPLRTARPSRRRSVLALRPARRGPRILGPATVAMAPIVPRKRRRHEPRRKARIVLH